MASANGSRGNVTTQVRQVEKALRKVYVDPGLLDASDLEGKPTQEQNPRLLSRALAAQAVRIVTGFSPAEAATTVIDGINDQGIDAIAVVENPNPHIYLVQAKWSPDGKAKSDRSAVKELVDGLRIIDDEDFSAFNPRGQQLAEYAKRVMDKDPVSVTQVIVLMRADDVTAGFRDALAVGEKDFNQHGEILDHRIILSSEIWGSIRQDQKPEPVNIEVDLAPWFSVSFPYESFQGIADAAQIAEWVRHESNLYDLNIRKPLGFTDINRELVETLKNEPTNFLYYNNGVTVLCESVERSFDSLRNPLRGAAKLVLRNASVVNGAQTVRSIVEAVQQNEDAGEAQVTVRIIVTGTASEFAKSTTQATNRQNRVERRDFVALDRVQDAIFEEMRAELGLEYHIRRGELEPHPQTGCSVVEAACALACAHTDPQYAARIATTLDVLWESGSGGMYEALFRPQPGIYLLWNSVKVLRAVRAELHTLHSRYQRRGAALIEHGAYLITHLTFRQLNTESIDEPDPQLEWATRALDEVPTIVADLVPALISAIDNVCSERAQIRAVCSDPEKCRDVVEYVLHVGEQETQQTQYKYQRTPRQRKRRRPNAVSIIVDRGLLAESEPLWLTNPTSTEAEALKSWLEEDPQRGRATWVPQRAKPIIWSADGNKYSPSGLVWRIWNAAEWEKHPVAVQGTARWKTSNSETLAELAWRALRESEELDFVDDEV